MKIAQVIMTDAWGGVSPKVLDQGIGGREGAMIRLGREWAKLGHEVTNFVPTKESERYNEDEGFHEYVPAQIAEVCMATFPFDAVVAWECPGVFKNPRVQEKQKVRLVEMQCSELPMFQDEHAPCATGFVALSPWHAGYLESRGFPDPIHVLPNCVDLEHYPRPDVSVQGSERRRTRNRRFFYSSSPDRGLVHLLLAWPKILKAWPDAELMVGYGVEKWTERALWSHFRWGEMAALIRDGMNQKGITDIGKVAPKLLADIQRSSVACPYPCDTIQPTETGCITALEAMASGTPLVTTDCDCLGEEFGDVARIVPLPWDEDRYVDALIETVENPTVYADMAEKGRTFVEEGRQWNQVAPRWIELFETARS